MRNVHICYLCSKCRISVCLIEHNFRSNKARVFNEIFRKEYAILYLFNMQTQLFYLYYIFTFVTGNIIINDGLLAKVIENDKVFIKDELNL